MAKEILFKIKIADLDTEIAQLGKLQGRIDELSKQQKESADKTSKAYQANALDLKELKKEYQQKQKYVQDSIKADKSQGDTVEALRTKLAIVTKQWNQLTIEEINNTKHGKALSKQKLELTNSLKQVESATGDARRNVGNYSDALKGVNLQALGFGKAQGMMNQAMQASKSAFNIVKMGLTTLKGALLATGIGAFVVVLGSLISYFTQTKRGADLVAQAMDGINAVINVLRDRLSSVGEAMSYIFSGEFKKGADILKNSFKGIGDEISNDVKAATALRKEMQTLEDAEIDYMTEKAKLQVRVSELEAKSRDEEKFGAEQRIAFLKESMRIQEEISAKETEFAKERARIISEQGNLAENMRADDKAIEQAKVDAIKKEKELNELRKRNLTELKALRSQLRKEDKDEAKIIDEQIKAEEAKNKEILEAEKRAKEEKERQAKAEAEAEIKLQEEIKAIREQYLMDDKQRMEAELAEMQARTAFEALAEEEKQIILKAIRDKYREEEEIAVEESLIQRAQKYEGYLDAIQQGLSIVSDFQKMKMDEELAKAGENEEKRAQIRKKYAEKQKKVAIAEAVILGAKGVLQALGSTPPPLSYVLAALTGVATGVQIAAIQKQTFADGGFTGQGTYRDSTGHKVAGIVHDNEYVVPKTVLQTPMGSSLVSQLEQLRGFADGGFTSTPEIPTTIEQMADLRVYVLESDITSTQQRVNVIENNVTF